MATKTTATKQKKVLVNVDGTVSLLKVGRPPFNATYKTISGEALEALKAGKTVKVSGRSFSFPA
jgi:hypothetical protein